MVEDNGMDVAFLWSNIRRPVGGGEYFLLDFLNYIKSSRPPVSVSVYDVNEGMALIRELNNYDVVVMHSLNEMLPLIPLIRVPMLLDVQSPDWLWYLREKVYHVNLSWKTKLKRLWIKMIGRSIHCRVLNIFDYETLGVYCREAFLIPEFIDTKTFKPTRPKSDTEFTILIRYDPSFKWGFDIFLKALTSLGTSKWLNIILFGRDPPQQTLNTISKHVNSVTSLGRLPRDSLVDIYSSVHATVIPSRFESFSIIAIESLACGTPIIMSRLPATLWYLKEIDWAKPGTGLSFKPGDPIELAQKIKFMHELWLNKNEIYLKSVSASRKTALRFDKSRIAPKYLNTIFTISKTYKER
jgi:glycosyltransferase involved in cell wall biosynthesis